MAAPRFRNHHHHGVRQGTAAHHEKFEDVVEHRGVGPVDVDDGEDFFDVLAKQRALQQGLARIHPVHIAAQGIDLAVVGNVAVGVGAFPAGEGVGGEARVNQHEGGVHVRILEVEEILTDLHRHQHAFINNGAARQAGGIPEGIQPLVADLVMGPLADDKELPLEILFRRHPRATGDENLAHEGLAGLGGVAEGGVVGRHVAPSQHALAFLEDDLFKFRRAGGPLRRVGGAVNHPHAVKPRFRQGDFFEGRDLFQKPVRHLHQNARAVPGVRFTATSAPVVQIHQNRQRLADDGMGPFSLHLAYETDTTGVVFKLGIVEALLLGESVFAHVFC
jgi:hypothetical protein